MKSLPRPAIVATMLLALGTAACGADGDDGTTDTTDDNGVTCASEASLVFDSKARTALGTGDVTCDGDADIELEVCVQWNPSGDFEDIQCMSGSESAVAAATVENLSSCGISAGRTFRTRVNATVDGIALDEELSAEGICF
jgi:hypothetical protein